MKTVDISGFGGGYEVVCQKMLTRGLVWASRNPFDQAQYVGCKGIFGLLMAKTAAAQALDHVMLDGLDATGAMHQAVVGHLMFILKNDYGVWLDEAGQGDEVELDDSEREAALDRLFGGTPP